MCGSPFTQVAVKEVTWEEARVGSEEDGKKTLLGRTSRISGSPWRCNCRRRDGARREGVGGCVTFTPGLVSLSSIPIPLLISSLEPSRTLDNGSHQVWIKPAGELPFLYGNHVVKAHLGRITEDTPEHQGVVVFSMADIPLGFGATARSTAATKDLDPSGIVVFHQA